MKQQLETLTSLANYAKNHFCRLPVLINGSQKARHQLAENFIRTLEDGNAAWVSEFAPINSNNFSRQKANNIIGKEFQCIIYDIQLDFDPNLFAALSGTLRGGGLMLVLCPTLDLWFPMLSQKKHWFLFRLIKRFNEFSQTININIDKPDSNNDFKPVIFHKLDGNQNSFEHQLEAIKKIKQVVKGHRNRPLVLVADRGRGKSAALGMAASELIKERTNGNSRDILITAPSLEACAISFKHAKINLPEAKIQTGYIELNSSRFMFMSPDEILNKRPKTELLIIDEAAGIPTPILEKLLNKYSRIVFATTIHGYEGSGHCFTIKFSQHLDKTTPGWKMFHLETPMRWRENDPLENLIDDLFLLKSKSNHFLEKIELSNLRIKLISSHELIQNENLLSEFYDLLSSAHYKTQPSDLKQIVDNSDINIYLVEYNTKLVAAAITINEGHIDEKISEQIYLGNRRPKGDIIPQSLMMHLGIKNAGTLDYLRIMRVAVQPDQQNSGVGALLIKHIIDNAKIEKADFVSCSFGASPSLLNFWNKLDFSLVRVGHHKKSQTNAHAALMIKPLSDAAKPIYNEALTHFRKNFPFLLKENLSELDSEISLNIFKNHIAINKNPLFPHEYAALTSFANSNRTYEDNISTIHDFSLFALSQEKTHQELGKTALDIILLKTIYGKSWKELTEHLNIDGKKQAINAFKIAISKLVTLYSK